MTEDHKLVLSDTGLDRRDAMLGTLITQLHKRQRRRRTRRLLAIGSLPMLALAGVAWAIVVRQIAPDPQAMPSGPEIVLSKPVIEVQLVRTDPAIGQRYFVTQAPSQIVILSDTTLLDALAQLGRPAGLVQTERQTWLTRDVADPM